ncbi:MAG: bifunctional phosphoribosyl-AMP cyclohydrolase/phosphoribosyl-ATP diphosphatase HisIE [bacterium]|nr:bifunctional phosphoribosyl-AMP cyclohydrolase/phosphoribosyl-ATP diphosphatase HisIE [bacterium]
MIIPSIDLMDGKAVQLQQGKEKILEKENVLELAKYFSRFGEIAVIDLDAAMNKGNNEETIKQICKIAKCRVGGGIRDEEKARRILSYGASKIIIGTKANEELLSKLPKERVIVAIDAKGGKITTEGWTKEINETPKDFVKRFDNLCSGYLYTIVDKEGMLGGTDIDAIKEIREITKNDLTAAGGITNVEEIKSLEKANINSQLGMSIYTGILSLEDAFCSSLDFAKNNGLIPTIVQDIDTKQVLMFAYSNKDAIVKSLSTGKSTYYSRSRKELWEKGLTSGNTQELISAKFDCDHDTLLYKVRQKGVACHLGRYSCFEDKDFTLNDLYKLLQDRKLNLPQNSYTTKLFLDRNYLNSKIKEEAQEVTDFENGEDTLAWEVADLTYFVLTLMVQNNVTIKDVLSELMSRTK